MTEARVTYAPLPDVTPKAELNALAAVYRFILDSHAKKEATPESRPDDAKGSQHDRAKTSIQR